MKYTAPALSRGLSVLEILSFAKNPLTVPKIANKLGLTNSTLFRIVYVLEQSGYIQRYGNDSYTLSTKLFEMGTRSVNKSIILDIIFPMLKDISTETNQSCYFVTKEQDRAIAIAKFDSSSLGLSIKIGHSDHLEHSCAGKSILAFLPHNLFEIAIKNITS